MRVCLAFVALVVCCVVVGGARAQAPAEKAHLAQAASSAQEQVLQQLAEVRRDQLNYRVEKDLLKEIYATNLQIVNGGLVFILGLLSVIGFLGLKDISSVKRDFMNELSELRRLKNEFEERSKEVRAAKEKIETEVLEITRTNDAQEKRIKVLELQEKASSLIADGNYRRALEYVAVGLDLDPKNAGLLSQKGAALWKLEDLQAALQAFGSALAIEPANLGTAANMTELAVLTGDKGQYETLIEKYGPPLDDRYHGWLTPYLEVLRLYLAGNAEATLAKVREVLGKRAADGAAMTFGWDYTDALNQVNKTPDSPMKNVLHIFLNVMRGHSVALTALQEIEKLLAPPSAEGTPAAPTE